MKYTSIAATLCLTILSGCASDQVQMVDTKNDQASTTAGIDYRDFEKAAHDSVQSMIATGAVTNPTGGRYVLMISRIKNETMQRIDVDELIKKIRVDLLNSGKVVVTTAVSAHGAEDAAAYQTRDDLRGNAEFDQSRVQQQGTMVAPDLSLSGKIIQHNLRNGSQQQIEYYFQLTLTDLRTGLALWENETPIVKRASGSATSW